jgi:histidinol-phosphate aminotransferase
MPPYKPVLPFDVLSLELEIPKTALVKLDANENPFGPLPEVRAALSALEHIHIYPDPESRRIRRLLAAIHQIDEGQIVVSAGADELIDLLMRIFLDPGDGLLDCPPTFGMYAFDGVLNHAAIHSVTRRSDFSLDLPAIEAGVEKFRPKLMFLANPNNPDGSLLSRQDLERLMDLPVVLVLDEAYMDFAGEEYSAVGLVSQGKNLIVLRTFSKWGALAGLRIGYGIFPLELVPVVMKAKQPYNVSVMAEEAAVVSLKHADQLNHQRDLIITQRERLFNTLKQITWLDPYPSHANFLLCKVLGIPAETVKERLRNKGILIRYFDKPGLEDHIRISIGLEKEIDQLILVLKGLEN